MALNAMPPGVILDKVEVASSEGYKPFTIRYWFHWFKDGARRSSTATGTQPEVGMTEADFNAMIAEVQDAVDNY